MALIVTAAVIGMGTVYCIDVASGVEPSVV